METKIYSVTELTSELKRLIEEKYPFIWIYGEISNISAPLSGHLYFTLKDEAARINSIIFKGQLKNLKFNLENGMSVIGFGRLGLYESKGAYQIIFEYLEPKGIGSLQIAYEQLKARLSAQGLFDISHKKELPFLPENISIITSPTGSVLYDILNIINRRYPDVNIRIIPVKVQGDSSESDIVAAIKLLNEYSYSDVAIIARGGGSLEELQAFNSEPVAKAIFESSVPIISAIGHETDYTISDFVSDYRAPTPSVAAEIVVPIKDELKNNINKFNISLSSHYLRFFEYNKNNLNRLIKRIKSPKRKIEDMIIKNEDLYRRIIRSKINIIKQLRNRYMNTHNKILINNPVKYIIQYKEKVNNILSNILTLINIININNRHILQQSLGKLDTLNPKAILLRGYSITRTIPQKQIVIDSNNVNIGQNLEVLVAKGSLICSVERKI
ncbi:MAG: exodeoxyribonuclease VII large subunit [Desulfobacteraceae bacterium]|nr:MAG: exodeoxyribonuclease VII large subunit [Desulfobacteraceae bacterium]